MPKKWLIDYISCINKVTVDELAIQKSFNILKEHIPSKLYRFRPLYNDFNEKNDYELDNLKKNRIWLSAPSGFNDPFDSKPLFNENEFENLIKYNDKLAYLLNKSGIDNIISSINDLLEKEIENFRISCFTENDYTNTLMWSHYANSHKGFCLLYDYNQDIFKRNEFFWLCINPVIYSKQTFDIAKHLYTMLLSAYTHLNNIEQKINFNNLLLYAIVLYKNKIWEYEKEWRIVMEKRLHGVENIINAPTPKAIYIGINTHPTNIEKLKQIALELKIDAYQMNRVNNSYQLIAKNVNK